MPTTLIRNIDHTTSLAQGGVLTIGNFDGVHLGHQALLQQVMSEAKQRNVPSVVLTFEPHPFDYFNRGKMMTSRLTRFREKFELLREMGIDYLILLKFNQQLATMPASQFATHYLVQALQPTRIILGDDFHFGQQRQGNIHLLRQLGEAANFTVDSMPTFIVGRERVSSTRVREALHQGELAMVKQYLGRSYTLMGKVRHGDKRGRLWGFPTANLALHRQLLPLSGVYAVLMHGISHQPLNGVANIGMRPTVDGTRALLEVHLLDFDGDIYGRHVTVEFCHKIRDEIRFTTIDKLKEQIANDVMSASQYFGERPV